MRALHRHRGLLLHWLLQHGLEEGHLPCHGECRRHELLLDGLLDALVGERLGTPVVVPLLVPLLLPGPLVEAALAGLVHVLAVGVASHRVALGGAALMEAGGMGGPARRAGVVVGDVVAVRPAVVVVVECLDSEGVDGLAGGKETWPWPLLPARLLTLALVLLVGIPAGRMPTAVVALVVVAPVVVVVAPVVSPAAVVVLSLLLGPLELHGLGR